MPLSFFHLTTPRPAPSDESPLNALTLDEFDACMVEGHPLFQALVETVNAYSEAHPELRLMAGYIAADMLRELLRQAVREAETDA
jgi:hypothetical protein